MLVTFAAMSLVSLSIVAPATDTIAAPPEPTLQPLVDVDRGGSTLIEMADGTHQEHSK